LLAKKPAEQSMEEFLASIQEKLQEPVLSEEEEAELEILQGEKERFYGEVNINAVELFKLTNQDPEAKWQKKRRSKKGNRYCSCRRADTHSGSL
jgi:predicted membrane GTPase involved in stress response